MLAAIIFESTLEPKGFVERFKARAKKASAGQLLKWARRTAGKRLDVTRQYLKLGKQLALTDQKQPHARAHLTQLMAICDIEAQRLDAWMAAMRSEAERRLLSADVFNPVRD